MSPLDESFCDVEIDGDGSSIVGVAVGGGRDVSGGDDSGGKDYSGDKVDPYEVDNDSDGSSEDDDKKASNPNCLDYSTDEDDEDNYIFDPDLEEFELVDFANPNKVSKTNREQWCYVGGHQPPDYSTMRPVDKKVAESDFIQERRRWCSEQRRSRMTNLSVGVTDFNGVLIETLRTMQQVEEGTPLLVGQSFPSRDIIMLQSAEEANLCGIHIIVHKSDKHTFKAYGNQFYINASNSESGGWKITTCHTREGDAGVNVFTPSDPPAPGVDQHASRSPFKVKWFVLLIYATTAEAPMASNKMLKAILLPYAKPYALTDGLIQGARIEARKEIFGSPEENVQYTFHMKNALLAQGHHVTVKTTKRKETIKKGVDVT